MATIELYGREVIPRVRELLSDPAEEPAPRGRSLASANGRSSSV
jgi:hypothetical protein